MVLMKLYLCWLYGSLCLQLNIRKLLEERGLPPINIICQKVGNEGLTRYEDRRRLPLGISVNVATFTAKMLAQVRSGVKGTLTPLNPNPKVIPKP
jgi:hypothetical protein